MAAMPAALRAQASSDQVITTREDAIQLTKWGFDQADTNRDGVLTWKEWKRRDDQQVAAWGDLDRQEVKQYKAASREFFRLLDTQKDDRVSREELAAWYGKLFDCQDENRDNVLTVGELERNDLRCSRAMGLAVTADPPTDLAVDPQPGPLPDRPSAPIRREELLQATGEQFDLTDANRDGFITPAEMRAADGQGDPIAPEAFRAFDKDRDGRISKPEFVAMSQGLFDCMDSNSDGAVTEDEGQRGAVRCFAAAGIPIK